MLSQQYNRKESLHLCPSLPTRSNVHIDQSLLWHETQDVVRDDTLNPTVRQQRAAEIERHHQWIKHSHRIDRGMFWINGRVLSSWSPIVTWPVRGNY